MKKFTRLEQLDKNKYQEVVSFLKEDYLESWTTLSIFSNKYNISIPVIRQILKKEGLVKDRGKWNPSKDPNVKKKIKQTKLERYGDENYNNQELNKKRRLEKYNGKYFSNEVIERLKNVSQETKNKAKEKARETFLKHYGVDNIFKNKEYIQERFKEKYNVNNPSLLQEVKNKKKNSFQKHYGVDCSFQASEVKNKIKQTLLNKYGVTNPGKSKELLEKSARTRIKKGLQYEPFLVDKFLSQWNKERKPTVEDFKQFINLSNVTNAHKMVASSGLKDNFAIKQSYLENVVEDFLKQNDIRYEKHNREVIKPQELDFYLPDYKVALEVNDIWTHNSSQGYYNNEPKPLDYHFKKTMKCNEKDIRLIHLFEPYIISEKKWPILQDIILHACNKNKKIYARNTEVVIKPAIQMKEFFEKNNIQGYRNAITAFVLIDKKTKEELMCYTVGNAWFGKGKYDAEIARGACKLGYSIVGGASKLWKYIIEYYKDKNLNNEKGSINSIVYYVDLNHYCGKSMNFLDGVIFIKNQLGFWNYWVKEKKLKNREPQRHNEIKKLIQEGKVLVIGNSGTQVNVWKREQ